MDSDELTRRHYSREHLGDVVLDALRAHGVDVDAMGVQDLGGLDQLHSGGVAATQAALDELQLGPENRLLDVGSGIGGPARLAAAQSGCLVAGIDLSPDFVAVARALTERVGLGSRVSFEVASALDLPGETASFDRAMLNHAGMNIADKARMFGEVRRVLTAGGRFVVYEAMRTGAGELTFPLPWATDARSSFVEPRERYAELLDQAGFRVVLDENRAPALAAAGPPPPEAMSPADVFGDAFGERLEHAMTAVMQGILSPVLITAIAD